MEEGRAISALGSELKGSIFSSEGGNTSCNEVKKKKKRARLRVWTSYDAGRGTTHRSEVLPFNATENGRSVVSSGCWRDPLLILLCKGKGTGTLEG